MNFIARLVNGVEQVALWVDTISGSRYTEADVDPECHTCVDTRTCWQ